jgi:hypothetical protein
VPDEREIALADHLAIDTNVTADALAIVFANQHSRIVSKRIA